MRDLLLQIGLILSLLTIILTPIIMIILKIKRDRQKTDKPYEWPHNDYDTPWWQKCAVGCKSLEYGETHHHKGCSVYPNTMSAKFDKAEALLKEIQKLPERWNQLANFLQNAGEVNAPRAQQCMECANELANILLSNGEIRFCEHGIPVRYSCDKCYYSEQDES